jgi:hypothetical protein
MAERNGGITGGEQRRHWLSDHIPTADHDRALAGDRDLIVIKELQPGQRRAWMEGRQAEMQASNTGG